MKILRVADVPDNRTGGMSRVMYGTGEVLRRQGHQVDYLFTEQLGRVSWSRLRRFAIPWRIVRAVSRAQASGGPYDVVEIHEPSAAVYTAVAGPRSGLPPAVVFSHGIEARGHRAALSYRERKGLPVSLKQRLSPLSVVWQANFALKRARQVICLNSEDADYLLSLGVPEGRITRVPNGIGAPFLEHGAARRWDAALAHKVLFLGTWIERKGVAELAEAATRVLSEYATARLTVAGCHAGRDEVLASFPEAVRPRIEVIPRLATDSTLIDLYAAHGVYVLPSYFEGLPLAMLEAAAMGLALVTTNVCGMRDFVSDGRYGLPVAPGDVGGLVGALRTLMADPGRVRTLGEAARERAQAYTWENAARATLTAYERAYGTTPLPCRSPSARCG